MGFNFLGRYQLGQDVPLLCQCADDNRTPRVPDACPWVKIWDQTGKLIVHVQVPVLERYVPTPGLFLSLLRLGTLFAVGHYTADWHYTVAGNLRVHRDCFEVIAGGDAAGNVLSMYYFNRPWASFVVQELDSGKLVAGRNPKL